MSIIMRRGNEHNFARYAEWTFGESLVQMFGDTASNLT